MPAGTAYQRRTGQFKRQREESLQLRACRYLRRTYPHVLFYADASGVNMSDTKRMNMSAMKSKLYPERYDSPAVRIPDLTIIHPAHGYVGAALELKTQTPFLKDGVTLKKQKYKKTFKKSGKVYEGDHLQEQADTHLKYQEAGFHTGFFWDYYQIIDFLDWYCGGQQRLLSDDNPF